MSQVLVHEYWTIPDHFLHSSIVCSGCHQHVLKNVNITFSDNTGAPEMFQYSPILGRSSIWDLKYTFSQSTSLFVGSRGARLPPLVMPWVVLGKFKGGGNRINLGIQVLEKTPLFVNKPWAEKIHIFPGIKSKYLSKIARFPSLEIKILPLMSKFPRKG